MCGFEVVWDVTERLALVHKHCGYAHNNPTLITIYPSTTAVNKH